VDPGHVCGDERACAGMCDVGRDALLYDNGGDGSREAERSATSPIPACACSCEPAWVAERDRQRAEAEACRNVP
jgi:hypothetical protein